MPTTATQQALDRHALVAAMWLTAGLITVALFHYGLGGGGTWFLLAAFAVILAAFAGHVVVNRLYATTFSARELALGLVVFATALVTFGLGMVVQPSFAAKAFFPVSAGLIALLVSVLFYMATTTGLRGAFDAFDEIRTFRAAPETLSPETPNQEPASQDPK